MMRGAHEVGDLAARLLTWRALVRAPIWLYRLRIRLPAGQRMLSNETHHSGVWPATPC